MASTQILPRPRDGVDVLLKEGDRLKNYAIQVTEKYVGSPESPLGTIHPSLSTSGALVPVRSTDKIVALRGSISNQGQTGNDAVTVGTEEDRFKKAMREYESTAKEKYKTGIDPDSEHTIKQLETVAAEAIDQYQTKDTKGFWGKIRLACRKLGDGSEDLQGWLGLLPTESEYLSVVAGGLKLILKAAARMRNVADKVLEALHQIPVIFGGAQRVLNIYTDSEKLKELSNAFYRSILAALGHILHYLRRKSASKVFQVSIQPASFQKDLLAKIDQITTVRNALNDEADLCHQEMQEKSFKLAEAADKNSEITVKEICKINKVLRVAFLEQSRANQAMREALDLLQMNNVEVRRIGQDVADIKRDTKELKELKRPLQLLMNVFLATQNLSELAQIDLRPLDTAESNSDREINRRGSVSTIARIKKTILSPSQRRRTLLSQLDYTPDVVAADLVANYRYGASLSRDDEDRSIFVIKSPKLAAWVTAERSSVLLVNGNAGNSQRRSAMTFVSARLVYALEKIRSSGEASGRPNIVPLYFFCGQHASGDHSWETPSGVVNSLLAQLLTHCRDVNLTKAVGLGSFDNDDMKAVVKRFECVLDQLSSKTTVFCVLDGLSFYLDNDSLDDTEQLIRRLLKLARGKSNRKPPYVLKLLLTVPNRFHTSEVNDLDNSEVLTVPTSPPSTGGFTSMKWTTGVGRQLKYLTKSDE